MWQSTVTVLGAGLAPDNSVSKALHLELCQGS